MTTNVITAFIVTLLCTNAPVSIGTYRDKLTSITYDNTVQVVCSNRLLIITDAGQTWSFLSYSTPIRTNPPVLRPVSTQNIPAQLIPPPLPTIPTNR